ncbi:hypothetical protein DMJ13_20965 [halophilic archaeon]|nr:hypothetical protein DMJ13_20965 [halophilic archaeon]
MNTSDAPYDREAVQVDSLPDSLTAGSTVLVACTDDPSLYAVGLHILCQSGQADDTAFIVTTAEGISKTIETYEHLCPDAEQPSLGVVDTSSKQQSVSAFYNETPAVFTPSPGDLERLVLALGNLFENYPLSTGAQHLLVRSLTPILDASSTDRVCTVMEQIAGMRSETGLCLLGVDYTAHDEETITAIGKHVDGVLWATESASNRLEFEYQPTKYRKHS